MCSDKNDAVVPYATGGIQAQEFAAHYLDALPDAELLRQDMLTTQRALTLQAAIRGRPIRNGLSGRAR